MIVDIVTDMKKKQEPTKSQKKKFRKGFFWGKIEHKLETYTTYTLLLGIIVQTIGLLERKHTFTLIGLLLFSFAFILRVLAGTAHKLEKHYMKYLRFGGWKNK